MSTLNFGVITYHCETISHNGKTGDRRDSRTLYLTVIELQVTAVRVRLYQPHYRPLYCAILLLQCLDVSWTLTYSVSACNEVRSETILVITGRRGDRRDSRTLYLTGIAWHPLLATY